MPVGLVLLAWVTFAGVQVLRARSAMQAGLDRLEQVRDVLDRASLLRGAGTEVLAAARADFARAAGFASSAPLAPLRVVPVLGSQLRSVRALTQGAVRVAAVGERASRRSTEILADPPGSGTERIAVVGALGDVARRAVEDLRGLELGPRSLLVPPLADARSRFAHRLHDARSALAAAAASAKGATSLLTGPRRFLVLAANNAEMRAGSGMFLSAGTGVFADGSFELQGMRPVEEYLVAEGGVTLPEQLAALWGWTGPDREWRNLATSPRFDETAPLAASMWAAATGVQVDGVLALDPIALAGVLEAQGPVSVDGQELTGQNVVPFLLHDQYVGLTTFGDQVARRDRLSGVAAAVLTALVQRPWDTTALVEQANEAGGGRHVLLWSRDPVEQRGWRQAGVAGRLRPRSLLVGILNFGGNKLDQFLDVEARLRVRSDPGGSRVAVRLRLHNGAPVGEPTYIAGPYPGSGAGEGVYQGIVAASLPEAAYDIHIEDQAPLLVAGRDGPSQAWAVGYFQLARGADRSTTIRFRLPPGVGSLRIEPSARSKPISWQCGARSWLDSTSEHVKW